MKILDFIKNKKLVLAHNWKIKKNINVVNPSNGDVIACVPYLSLKEIQENIDNTCNAFSSWSRTSTNYRSEILKKWGELITKNINDLSYILTLEQGKTLKDAKKELLYAISFINWFADLIYHVQGSIKPGNSINHKITTEYEPLGVVAAITPWNFPYAMIARKISPAIVAGCTVVFETF